MSTKALTPTEELGLLSHLAQVTSATNLDELLSVVLRYTPALINATGCSIYLRPEFVPQFDGILISDRSELVQADQIKNEIVVLAASTRLSVTKLVGKLFYESGQGLSGWVLKYGKPLQLADASDESELESIAQDLHWTDKYHTSSDSYEQHEKKPILIVPLLISGTTIGILRFPSTLDKGPFAPFSEAIAVLVAQIVANAIRNARLIQSQGQNIAYLVALGTETNSSTVYETVTKRLKDIIGGEKCQLYLRDYVESGIKLVYENGVRVPTDVPATCDKSQELVDWVFRTSTPLLIKDSEDYAQWNYPDDTQLAAFTSGTYSSEESCPPRHEQAQKYDKAISDNCVPYIAVPVKVSDGYTEAVLCVIGNDESHKRLTPTFDRNDLAIAQGIANTIAIVIANERLQTLSKFLTQFNSPDPSRLYDLIINYVPILIPGSACDIYINEITAEGPRLHIIRSSKESKPDDLLKDHYETLGLSGLCAQAQATLVLNHYGSGVNLQEFIAHEAKDIRSRNPQDLVRSFYDDRGYVCGIIRLEGGQKLLPQVQREFIELAESLLAGNELRIAPSIAATLTHPQALSFWSCAAIPMLSGADDLYGVITVTRKVKHTPFIRSDVSLLETTASRLAIVLRNHQLQEQRVNLLMSLAHEINTPLQGVIADSENLLFELPVSSHLVTLAKHNLEQVLKLQLLAETFMTSLSSQTPPQRAFSVHSIYRPLKDACEMFSSEATAKGCQILEPKLLDSDEFPEIEMSLFDLTLAFKNIIHNAVKYSFRGSGVNEGSSGSIRVTGHWFDADHTLYAIDIQNYGVGITEDEIKRRLVFNPYYRGENASDHRRTGFGLGLAHARQIIEDLHHGSILVTSKLVHGNTYLTTFTVKLPLKQP